ncbi:MAG: DNA primase [Ignavibacteriaceae bacterium]|nr:DNA primase [Ignavibacteriaceae bacterium]
MRISENKIEEIRSAANIVDVISEYIQLRKRGKNFIGLCPFHNEKTPSFTVSEDKQIFHCFGCHTGGNVFKFLMEYEKISFIESIQEMAHRYGINIDVDEEEFSGRQTEQEILYDLNTEAAKYFSNILLSDQNGEIAREYFQKRKIKLPTIRAFGLGYSLPGRDNFVNYAQEKKLDLERAVALGLIGTASDGRLYDRFSGRIIFPIFSPNGRVIAFGGRILETKDSNKAKYLNSPESSVYVKGRILYGLSFAKDDIRKLDKAILVEGYMDLISLHQAGIKNVVAVSGTALTEDQVQLLSRYTKNVVLLFDADTAGIKASMRSIELLLKRDMEIKIASLPSGEDPDSYVNNYGSDSFEEVIKKAQNFLEYQTAFYESQGMFDDPSKTAEAIRDLVKPVAIISDELKRKLLIKMIAKRFGLRENLLETELEKAVSSLGKQVTNEERIRDRELQRKDKAEPVENSNNTTQVGYNTETEIIGLLFKGNEEVVKFIAGQIPIDEFNLGKHIQLAEIVYNALENGEEIITSALIDKIKEEELQLYVRELVFDKYSISKDWDDIHPGEDSDISLQKTAKDTVTKFKVEKINYQIQSNYQKAKAASTEEERFELAKINSELEKEKISLNKN